MISVTHTLFGRDTENCRCSRLGMSTDGLPTDHRQCGDMQGAQIVFAHQPHSFASGASPIRSVHSTYFYTRLEIDSAIRAGVGRHDLGPLSGLSGGPVFVWRRGPVLRAELVGFVTEYAKEYDLFHVRRSTCIASDGTLIRP